MGIDELKKVLNREYRASVTILAVVLMLLVMAVSGYVRAETWVVEVSEQAHAPAVAKLTDLIEQHETRIRSLEAEQKFQHDLLIQIGADVRYMREANEAKRKR